MGSDFRVPRNEARKVAQGEGDRGGGWGWEEWLGRRADRNRERACSQEGEKIQRERGRRERKEGEEESGSTEEQGGREGGRERESTKCLDCTGRSLWGRGSPAPGL